MFVSISTRKSKPVFETFRHSQSPFIRNYQIAIIVDLTQKSQLLKSHLKIKLNFI